MSCLYYIEATILNLWCLEKVGGAGNARKATACLGGVSWSRQVFPGCDKVFLFLCRDMGPLCHDMALRLDAVARSRHSFFSMSRQCFASLL